MQSLMAHFKNVFDYLFNAEWNPEYANAPHIKISPSTDARYPNEIRIAAIDSDGEIYSICAYDADLALEPMSVEYEPLEDEIDELDEEAALGYPNCPNCADQTSIAAPGQITLCKTHEDEKHFHEMKEFFIEEVERITFRPHLPFCSCCGKETSQYVGIIVTNSSGPLSFSFCIDCRDELTLKQNAARAAQERIGV